MAGKLKWWEAAEIIGVCDRTMRRWRERYEEYGYDGLYDYRKRRPSPRRVPLPGDGISPLERILRKLSEKEYSGSLSVELFLPQFQQADPYELARRIRERAEPLMRRAGV
jgi:sugar phosphate isomerase/epimerase